MAAIRVLLVDDHPVVRHGLRSLLANHDDVEVIGEAGDPLEADRLVQFARPDVVLLDICLGGGDGLACAREWRYTWPEMKIIVLTAYDDNEYLTHALATGAHAYLLKTTPHQGLVEAIRAVYAGHRLVSPRLIDPVLEQFAQMAREQARLASGLSPHEIEVLRLLAQGASLRDVADHLFWSEATVKRKIQDAQEKLGAANRVQAVAEAIRRGLI